MKDKKIVNTAPGMRLVRKLARQTERIFTTARARDLAMEIGLSGAYFKQALNQLTKAGCLVTLRKGLFTLSATLPEVNPAHPFEIAMALVAPVAISHGSALRYHGLTEQAPDAIHVLTSTEAQTPRATGGYRVNDRAYRFIRVKPDRFFGTEEYPLDDQPVTLTDPERTLLDGLAMPECCGDFKTVLKAFAIRGEHLNVDRIIDYALRLDAALAKRLGWVLENQGIPGNRLEPLVHLPSKGYRPLDPTGKRQGPCNKQWLIQDNFSG